MPDRATGCMQSALFLRRMQGEVAHLPGQEEPQSVQHAKPNQARMSLPSGGARSWLGKDGYCSEGWCDHREDICIKLPC